jgi:hypothetical protein
MEIESTGDLGESQQWEELVIEECRMMTSKPADESSKHEHGPPHDKLAAEHAEFRVAQR